MAKTTSQTLAALAILTVLAVATLAVIGADPERKGGEVHMFEVTVRVPDHMVEDYNYMLLATVLGSLDAARRDMFETEPGTFSAFITNNQARELSKVKGCWEFGKGMILCLRTKRATDIRKCEEELYLQLSHSNHK